MNVVILLLYVGGLFSPVEEWGLNHRFYIKYLLDGRRLESPIVIVGIDGKSLKELGRWPWPRTTHAALLTKLAKEGARVVGLDLILDQPADWTAEMTLSYAMERLNLVIPVTFDLEMDRGRIEDETAVKAVHKPLFLFAEKAALGHIHLIPDPDGVVRKSYPYLGEYPSFALALARAYQPEREYLSRPFRIHYRGPAMSFPVYSYVDILQGRFPVGTFTDKIVLIGGIDPALGDQFVTPLARFGLMSGIEVHAHQLATLLANDPIRPLPLMGVVLLLILSGSVCGVLTNRLRLPGKMIAFPLLGLGYYLYGHYLFIQKNILVPYAPVGILLGSYLVLGILFSYHKSNAERTRLYEIFYRYLAPQVLTQVFERPEEIKLGGARKQAAVLFIDIRGFTAYTQAHQPEEVVVLLNRYLQLFADVIFAYEGTLDKFLGDGLMAVFGAPVEGADDPARAYRAALEIKRRINEEDLPLAVGMGLAYGPVISGNIGSEKRMDYTVIGNTVNTASRLEELAGADELVLTRELAGTLGIAEQGTLETMYIKGMEGAIAINRLR